MSRPTNFDVLVAIHQELVDRDAPRKGGFGTIRREGYPILGHLSESELCAMSFRLGRLPRGDAWEPPAPPRVSFWCRLWNWAGSWS